jgi:hypothetical protein
MIAAIVYSPATNRTVSTDAVKVFYSATMNSHQSWTSEGLPEGRFGSVSSTNTTSKSILVAGPNDEVSDESIYDQHDLWGHWDDVFSQEF